MTEQAASLPATTHRAYLDGLRALAALWVVLSHLWISQFGIYAQPGLLGLAINWTLYSHLAVDVFIVLSGYCLMLPVAREGVLRGGAWAFYRRRARRILPPFYAALFFSVLAGLLLQALARQAPGCNVRALAANVLLLQDLSPAWNVINGPFWSIAVEWRIYFLFPVMAWLAARWGLKMLPAAALAGYGATWFLRGHHPEMMQASPWYLLLFALGICAASQTVQNYRKAMLGSFVVAGAALAGLLCMHPVTLQNGADFGRWLPVIDAAAGIGMASLLARPGTWMGLRAALSWRPLTALGTFAYSLYLVHMPCLLLLSDRLNFFWPTLEPIQKAGLLAVFGLPVIVGFSYLFFLAFERPFLSRQAARSSAGALHEASCGGLAGRANKNPCK